MPIQLTSSYDTGSLDGALTHVKVVEWHNVPDSDFINLTVQHGKIVEGNFVRGIPVEGQTVKHFTISGSDYSTMVASTSAAAGEVYYDKVAGLLYQWLLDNSHYAGTIV